ncbi:MAG: coproporphyrinogen III oxidase [Bacteroidetes bacterium]|nr:coproporphyrinogen III oxidase [Bacteroidota bacterium]
MNKESISNYFKKLQDDICIALQSADGKAKFKEDLWQRAGGGGGRTRIIQNGNVIEKGGVNFSSVFGKTPEKIANLGFMFADYPEFYATGISIVIHPYSPMIPIIHMNLRYFELNKKAKPSNIKHQTSNILNSLFPANIQQQISCSPSLIQMRKTKQKCCSLKLKKQF